ncbi:hypothetical protein TraAM80_00524 [Trypanosoma rangeli]|uniref:Uncharacterized protein n=1 Tax=Trypanosoma rangeli TaxID=5698 RepID=A0A3R7LD90_TRYRA|nr:uncharacterized protein TraAM80_00524 [Trypanosoma rangeli]RNF12103.1 hypothetical protein TraAM80_00524 [Trypanosoma rangeli]|eukprot:RNF12103.1 hypothetical protein TraAM80_00524 [Trypanosoma rangeli]
MSFLAPAESSQNGSSNASGEAMELHVLLSNTQFAFLVVFCGVCHYFALVVSALTVGESTTTLTLPFVLVKKLLASCVAAVRKFVWRRREHVFVGVGYDDDDASIDRFDAMNQPAEAGFQ